MHGSLFLTFPLAICYTDTCGDMPQCHHCVIEYPFESDFVAWNGTALAQENQANGSTGQYPWSNVR